MKLCHNFADMIGNTPLVRLNAPSEATGCNILGKAEFLNPGGSVKDRTALGILLEAEKSGALKRGDTIIEGTAGNTGIGLTLLANARGYRSIVVMPMTQSREKIDHIELLGAELHLVPATSYDDPNHYVHTAKRMAEKMNESRPGSAIWARQFDNTANRDIHYATTGKEILEQTNGKIDGFVCAVGTGGTLAGVGKHLKEHNENVLIGVADPMGSSLYHYIKDGELRAEGNSITEGIGINHITDNLQGAKIDTAFQIDDQKALPYVFSLLKQQGLCLGGSSGVNVAAAVEMAKEMGPGHTIVTILCDHGTRYQSKLFNPVFLRNRNLPAPDWLN